MRPSELFIDDDYFNGCDTYDVPLDDIRPEKPIKRPEIIEKTKEFLDNGGKIIYLGEKELKARKFKTFKIQMD